MAQTPVQSLIIPDIDPGTTIYAKSLGAVPPISGNITVQVNETIEKITNINQFITKESQAIAGGGSHQVQFNLDGQLAGDNKLTFDYVTTELRIQGSVSPDRIKTDEIYHANNVAWHFYNNLDTSNYLANHAGPITGTTITTGGGTIGALDTVTLTATDVSISGNLIVNGTTTYLNTTSLTINDKNIVLANNASNRTDADGAGITINGANLTLTYANASNSLVSSHDLIAPNANLGNVVRANYFIGDAFSLNNLPSGNITGQVANANIADRVYNNSQPNITSVGTLISLDVTGNITAGNIDGGDTVTANFYIGDGYQLGNLTGDNVTGQVANANIADQVYNNSQPNITSVGTLVSLDVTGNVMAGNIDGGNTVTANYFVGDGYQLGNLTGDNVTGEVAYANVANNVAGANVSGQVSFAATANSVSGANVSGQVAYANVANNVTWGNVSGSPTALEYFNNGNTKYITLANLSVTNIVPTITGSGNLEYDNTTGLFTFNVPVFPTSLSAFTNDPVYVYASNASQNLSTLEKENAKTNLGLHVVATSGSYDDLSNTPTDLTAFSNGPAYVSFSDIEGADYAKKTYVDSAITGLVNSAPTTLDTLKELANALANDASFSTTVSTSLGNRLRVDIDNQNLNPTQKQNAKTNLGLHVVATSGNYNDLNNKPSLQTVATSGSYNDLTNLPTLSTLSATGSWNDLLDKPNFVTVATSGSYNDLINKPDLKTVATSGSYNDLMNIPDFANLYVSRTEFNSVITQLFSLITDGGTATGQTTIDGGLSSSTFTTTIDGGVA